MPPQDASRFVVSDEEFARFVERHAEELGAVMVPEGNDDMRRRAGRGLLRPCTFDMSSIESIKRVVPPGGAPRLRRSSYLLLDEQMRFVNCSAGGKVR